jgi:hypothetical protein
MKDNFLRLIPNPFYDFIAYILPGTILFIMILDLKGLFHCDTFNNIRDISTIYQLVLLGLLILVTYFLGAVISSVSPLFFKIPSCKWIRSLPLIRRLQYKVCEKRILEQKDEIIKCLHYLGYLISEKKITEENVELVRQICKRFLRQNYEKMADLIVKRDAKIMLIENMFVISLFLFAYNELIVWWVNLIFIAILLVSLSVQIKSRAKELVSTFFTCAKLEIKKTKRKP